VQLQHFKERLGPTFTILASTRREHLVDFLGIGQYGFKTGKDSPRRFLNQDSD